MIVKLETEKCVVMFVYMYVYLHDKTVLNAMTIIRLSLL